MFGTLARGWTWFVEGLAEALLWGLDRVRPREAFRIDIGEGTAVVASARGAPLGRLLDIDATARFEPPELGRRLVGAAIDVSIPPAWLFRRTLDPVAAQSAPFLDAFVRHHIDRITPWRAADVYYRIIHAPLVGDPARLSVEVGVVPKRFVAALVATLDGLGPGRLRLVAGDAAGGPPFAISLGGRTTRRAAQLRRGVSIGLWVLAFTIPASLAWIAWQTASVQGDIDDVDRVIEERKAVLAAAARHDKAGTAADKALRLLRDSRPRAVDLIEALSAALPDTAYLTELTIDQGKLRIAGVSTATPQLVPSLETAGRFADVAFDEATTRVEQGAGDRFHIEMRPASPPKVVVSPDGAATPQTAAAP